MCVTLGHTLFRSLFGGGRAYGWFFPAVLSERKLGFQGHRLTPRRFQDTAAQRAIVTYIYWVIYMSYHAAFPGGCDTADFRKCAFGATKPDGTHENYQPPYAYCNFFEILGGK